MLTEFSPHARGKYGRQPRCKDCCTAANTARYWASPEASRAKTRERARAYQLENPAARNASRLAWAAANPEKDREAKRKWAANNAAENRAIKSAWSKSNRTKMNAYMHKRRALLAGAGGAYVEADVVALFRKQVGQCALCACDLAKFEVDHIIPVARGGSSSPENIQLLCRPCNRRKGAR